MFGSLLNEHLNDDIGEFLVRNVSFETMSESDHDEEI